MSFMAIGCLVLIAVAQAYFVIAYEEQILGSQGKAKPSAELKASRTVENQNSI
jgi:hypothetical protein